MLLDGLTHRCDIVETGNDSRRFKSRINWISSWRVTERLLRIIATFLKGLKETGYVERQNVAIGYRWAEDLAPRVDAPAHGS